MMRGETHILAASERSSIALLREAVFAIARIKDALLPAVIVPVAGWLTIRLFVALFETSVTETIALTLATIPFYVIVATVCHRLILLGDDSLPNRLGFFWSQRETRFIGWMLVLGLLGAALALPIWFLVIVFPIDAFEWGLLTLISYAAMIVGAYADGRFSLVLPATAIGHHLTLSSSWKLTKGRGWRIATALLIPVLTLHLIEYIVFAVLELSTSRIASYIWGVLTFPLVAVEVAIISVAYKWLADSEKGNGN